MEKPAGFHLASMGAPWHGINPTWINHGSIRWSNLQEKLNNWLLHRPHLIQNYFILKQPKYREPFQNSAHNLFTFPVSEKILYHLCILNTSFTLQYSYPILSFYYLLRKPSFLLFFEKAGYNYLDRGSLALLINTGNPRDSCKDRSVRTRLINAFAI